MGAAAKTISGLPLSGSNYNHAVYLLMKRFGSKQVIISKHIEMLMQLPKLNNSNDLKQLRQLLDKTEATTRSLQGIGVSSETYGTFLTLVIMAKIPQELRLKISHGMSYEWDLDTVMKSLAEELQIRERCTLGPVSEQTRKLGVKEKRDWISSRSNQGTSHFINVVFKPRRTTAEQRNVVFFLQRPSSIKQMCFQTSLILRQRRTFSDRIGPMFWLFKEWSHQ